jgi:hypothetical protein
MTQEDTIVPALLQKTNVPITGGTPYVSDGRRLDSKHQPRRQDKAKDYDKCGIGPLDLY